jgi:hypothetical protein
MAERNLDEIRAARAQGRPELAAKGLTVPRVVVRRGP